MEQNLSIKTFSGIGWVAIYVDAIEAMRQCGSDHVLKGTGYSERESILDLQNQFFNIAIAKGKLVRTS